MCLKCVVSVWTTLFGFFFCQGKPCATRMKPNLLDWVFNNPTLIPVIWSDSHKVRCLRCTTKNHSLTHFGYIRMQIPTCFPSTQNAHVLRFDRFRPLSLQIFWESCKCSLQDLQVLQDMVASCADASLTWTCWAFASTRRLSAEPTASPGSAKHQTGKLKPLKILSVYI